MAARGFSVKAPKEAPERRLAVYGWGAGAFVAIGALAAALQLAPMPSGTGSQFASAPADMLGDVDPIITGSINQPQVLPSRTVETALPGLSMQGQLDDLKIEMAALRDTLAASQAANRSTLRRVGDLERNLTLFTASVGQSSGAASDQPLPARIDGEVAFVPAPRVVLPAPIPVEGGEIAVRMRPMAIGEPSDDPTETGSIDLDADEDLPDDEMTVEAAETDTVPAEALADVEIEAEAETALEDGANLGAIPQNPDMDVMLSATPFAVDIGGSETLEGIDRLWQEHQSAFDSTLNGYEPRILLQQTSNGALDLRLVVGPIPDAADAAMLCAQLVASGMQRCLPAIFDGQQLALR
ncbi:MAG: SPOR domain-containing protein [Pseudomonadota bacterium]